MALFKGKSNDDWRDKRSREQLALGGLPLNAERRLRVLQERKGFFTSSLSASEFALARAERIQPLGQVTGTCVFHVGWQPTPVYNSGELTVLTEAHNRTWRLALSRLQKEAQTLGAHGVVGVHLTPKLHVWGANVLEVSAQGTAIRWEGANPASLPFVSALSGQEFWSLLTAGYRPVGVAFGTCVYYQVTTAKTRKASQSNLVGGTAWNNQEMREYTNGLNHARRHAIRCMEAEAVTVSAEGVVGVKFEKHVRIHKAEVEVNEQKQERHDLITQFSAVGTAISPFSDAQARIRYVMPLTT